MLRYDQVSPELRSNIIRRYIQRENPCNFAHEYNLHPDIVYQVLYEENLVPPREYTPRYQHRCYEWKLAVAMYYQEPHSLYETRDFFHTSNVNVEKVMEEFNLPRRTHAEELRIAHCHTFGSLESYREHMIAAQKETCKARYNVDNYAKTEEFRKRAVATFNSRYGVNNPMQSDVIKQHFSDNCKEKHGVAWPCMLPQAKLGGIGSDSGPNLEFYAKLQEYVAPERIQREFCVERFNYDFKVGNTLIEIDPTSTHNSTWGVYKSPPKEKTYHYDKSKLAAKHGYRCIHIFDWDNIRSIMQLLIDRPRVYARDCVCREIDKDIAKEFLEKNHLQRYARDTIRIGLFHKEILVSVMTFSRPRYNRNYEYELIRYCSTHQVVGGAEKLFSYFINSYNPKSIISYCDLSKFTGATYKKLGFELHGSSISKHWFRMKDGKHITDNLLRQRGVDQLLGTQFGKGTSNEQLMRKQGFVEIYDAGQATYVWNKQVEYN